MTNMWGASALLIASKLGLFILLTSSVYTLLRSLPSRQGRWTRWPGRKSRMLPEAILRLVGLRADTPLLAAKRGLLATGGLDWDVRQYEAWRRLLIAVAAAVAVAALTGGLSVIGLGVAGTTLAAAIALSAAILLLADSIWLGTLRDQRSHRIVQDVYGLSRQLLYYAGSNMNLHVKLTRCLPFAGKLRAPLGRLLVDWYNDPAEALDRFRERLGTEEGHSFTDTLQAMRLNDDPDYYVLLRLRLQDYKEKIELHKESRKESISYVLFVVAGLPILYTFRVFLHPWIMEGQQLFESLS